MSRRRLPLLVWSVVVSALSTVAWAQAPAGPPAAGGGRGRGPAVVSPEVSADGRITLRLAAPNAQQVTASGELDGKSYPLARGDNGIWSVTIGPLPPDIYTYSFNVDGLTVLDPRNTNTKMGYGGFGPVSVVQVPGAQPDFWDVRPVPHGAVRIHPYVSKALGVSRNVWIYTPPDYDKGKNYPVFYLLHGAGDIESGWTLIGRANNILDNLIAEGRARPMVVVMPLGHAIQGFYAGPVRPASTGAATAPGGLSAFARDLLEDVMPMVEKTMKVSARAEDRAIGGLSMGGGQAINIAFNRPELFRYVILMSPAANNVEQTYAAFLKDAAAANKQFKVLWLGVGKDDTLTGPGDRILDEALTRHGINHTFTLTNGRHEWTVWRHHLHDVAPLLFK